ncbi:hypothetical protein PGTUg99_017091 [Puccinia graminis f. sp. tritici]|uniref:DNA-directed DNA polymerase n=1 Tax=Puccinia graminis f. sp. tritici TaxID=56615 RepID=A0A5B0PL68_PUCGR|nr:hypothetical protein PGTUg99_017091 [Puccinia graminis f. sp. tritici]
MAVSTRPPQNYDPLSRLRDEFVVPFKARSYAQQFAKVYFLRLSRLRERLKEKCLERWKAQTPCRVLDIDPSRISVVIGTLYCEMKLKPNVLEDLAREHHLGPALGPRKWVSTDEDSIMLEDESGRVRLVGIDREKFTLVTGIIVGVMGRETSKGDFQVHDLIYAGVPDQPRKPTGKKKEDLDQGLVALVSGLDLDNNNSSRTKARAETLVEWLNGQIGGDEERRLARSVGRLVIAGNLTRVPSVNEPPVQNSKEATKLKRSAYEPAISAPPPTDPADQLLSQLDLPVDLMPGPTDPTIQSLPQQALHRCLFPKATALRTAHPLNHGPNPWWAEIGGASFLGTSGQNLDDIYKYVVDEDRLRLATQMLEWSHIAPTAPDTLRMRFYSLFPLIMSSLIFFFWGGGCWTDCYPFRERDPFVLSELPQVYFVGNQPEFKTHLQEYGPPENRSRTRIILLPRFSRSGTIVLVDPISLVCQTVLLLPSLEKLPDEPDDLDSDGQDHLPPEKLVMEIDAGDDDDE